MLQPFYMSVDFKQKSQIREPIVTQYDDLIFVVTVNDNGSAAVIDGLTYRFVSRRPDNKSYYVDGVKSGDNEITFDLGKTEVSLIGKVNAAVQLFDSNNQRLSSFTFNYTVTEDISLSEELTSQELTLLEYVVQEGPGLVDYFTQAKPLVEQFTDYVNDLNQKANVIDVNTAIANMGSASPKGTYTTLTALQTAFPTGTTGIYVVSTDGKWYYWNGSAWTAGGTYQSTGIAKGSVTADSVNVNTYYATLDYGTLVAGYINSNGTLGASNQHKSTDYIAVEVGKTYKFPNYNISVLWGAIYNSSKTFITSDINDASRFTIDNVNACVYFTPKIGDSFIRLTASNGVGYSIDGFYFQVKSTLTIPWLNVNENNLDIDLQGKINRALETVVPSDINVNAYYAPVDYGTLVAGYISGNGTLGASNQHKSTDYVAVEIGKTYKFPNYNISVLWGAIYNSSKTFLTSNINDVSRFTIDNVNACVYFTPKIGDSFIRLTASNGVGYSIDGFYFQVLTQINIPWINVNENNLDGALKVKINQTAVGEKPYSHSVNKPYVFNGKTALFFGDSITEGFTSGSTKTTNGYPKVFSDRVGLTFTNKGIGGSLFTSGYNAITTIVSQIQSTTLNTNYIFIAGGINDWQLGVPLNTFKTTLTTLCEYLKTNFTGDVIFITPINHSNWHNAEIEEVDDYRKIIIEYACQYGYSVVDGSKFNFPSETGDYATLMFGDGLHPTELGYKVYAKGLATVLC